MTAPMDDTTAQAAQTALENDMAAVRIELEKAFERSLALLNEHHDAPQVMYDVNSIVNLLSFMVGNPTSDTYEDDFGEYTCEILERLASKIRAANLKAAYPYVNTEVTNS